MAQKTLKINGTDRSALVTPYGYSVAYLKIHGANEGTMLDGSTTEDVIAVKAEVTVPIMPLTETNMNALLSSLYGGDYATVYYFDPRTNAYRTITAMYSELSPRHALTSADGNEYWITDALVLTER